jgi:hypothetical protein
MCSVSHHTCILLDNPQCENRWQQHSSSKRRMRSGTERQQFMQLTKTNKEKHEGRMSKQTPLDSRPQLARRSMM